MSQPRDRINARLTKPLAEHVDKMVGESGLFETPSEYIRSLIRRDMHSDAGYIRHTLTQGFEDVLAGRTFESTGDWEVDKKRYAKAKVDGWI